MMKLGIISGHDAAAFDYVKGKGLEFIETCCNNDREAGLFVSHTADVKANMARSGIAMASVGRWAAKPNKGGTFDEGQMESQYALFDAAAEVGAPVFVCGCNYDPGVSLYKNYSFAVEYFGRLLDRAKGKSIRVAVYNCSWENFVCSPREWEVVLGELPQLGIKYDCSHSIGAGRDYLTELSDWGERILHFHVKGTVITRGRYVDDPPAGMDGFNWGEIFAILYARGYDAGLSIEPHSATWQGNSELGKKGIDFTIKYIRQYIL
ncbi:MAG: sugar phosphate isomerase/epimerase [Eubacteriales bacterium]|jgi:sugar phosphate isomerase/epimerase|nr:sugar phosphate isomerase/epimerase [Eubacteriales bacterium]